MNEYPMQLYNGNIAQTIWKSGDDNVKRGYVYNYDELNRLLEAQFYKSDNNPFTGAYTENLAYDLNGNITSLFRTTGDVYGESVGMDDLAYSYQDGNRNSNLLLNVSDAVSNQNTGGFKDGNTNPALDDYEYDENGNMVKDRNKGITSITYNHLNLPERIEWSANKFITYQYNAAGQKVTKTVRNNDSIKVVRYLDGFQYAGDILQFFPHAEGYVKATPTGNITPGSPPTAYAYNYVFNYTDHLGNIRLSYTKDPQQGTLKILEENHYYPFGLKHEVYVTGSKRDFIENSNDPGETILTNVLKTDYQYKYNGKEWQDELGLNIYDFEARNYMPDIGRTTTQDPMAEMYYSTSSYAFFGNNPIIWTDPTGMAIEPGSQKEWDRQTARVEKQRDKLQAKIDKTTAKADAKGWSAEKLAGKIGNMQDRVNSLNETIDNLGTLEASDQVYALKSGAGEEGGTTYDPSTGNIVFSYNGTANFVHETTHGGQFESGDIAFDTETGKTYGSDVFDEVAAYKAQFGYSPSSVSGLTSSSTAKSFGGITTSWVQGLTKSDGSKIYAPGGSANTGISPVNMSTNRDGLIKAYPHQKSVLSTVPASTTLKDIPTIYYKK